MATFTDNFTRPDSATTLGPPWVVPTNGGTWGISSNQAASLAGGSLPEGGVALVNGLSDGFVEVTVVNYGSALGVGPCFRMSADGHNGFIVTDENLARYTFPGAANIASWSPLFGTEPVTLRATFTGSSIVITNVTAGTTLATVTDANYTTQTWHGMANGASASCLLDDFSCTVPDLHPLLPSRLVVPPLAVTQRVSGW